MHLIEDYGGYYKWYKLTDDEKEQMLRKYGASNYFKFCQFVENNIGYIKDAIFVIKIGAYVVSELIMIGSCEDKSCVDSWKNSFLTPFS